MVKPTCPKGMIINPKSGRCVSLSGRIGQLLKKAQSAKKRKTGAKPANTKPKAKPATKSGKILNPASGRYVNASGILGKAIAAAKRKKARANADPEKKKKNNVKTVKPRCKPGKIYNPATNHCVSVHKKTGKALVKAVRRRKDAAGGAIQFGPAAPIDRKKPCPSGTELNRGTGRCVKKAKGASVASPAPSAVSILAPPKIAMAASANARRRRRRQRS